MIGDSPLGDNPYPRGTDCGGYPDARRRLTTYRQSRIHNLRSRA